ncbi:hypothetical protein AMTRI_Chr01g105050 [Amborella trichopoda]|uniref:Bifunctional inhibitor/plant lipid transfer protein/seed storage helical domain-containing protein n=1 Tax=Amborella trichopoda TaxID=13333 RepID=U5CSR2_AMBTC|nr:uncharacterized protein LOC18444591 [Amborella trichopoda]ERN16286.1 hypothetical protein AMTR_s00063p00186540 [Amborella trichopoda]|eukprot:XP_006854819.1 uncharacterized protein LOC18444591 [Amborella trichopoda]
MDLGWQKVKMVSLVVVSLLLVLNNAALCMGANNGRESPRCQRQVSGLVNSCKGVLSMKATSPTCCDWIRSVDLATCICPKVTPQIASIVQVKQVVRVLKGCGRRTPRNFRCGSIVIP